MENSLISLDFQHEAWYMEQLKLRQQEKFGSSNEVEVLREPIWAEPDEETLIPAHKRKKQKRGVKFHSLPVETIEYKLAEEEKVCDV